MLGGSLEQIKSALTLAWADGGALDLQTRQILVQEKAGLQAMPPVEQSLVLLAMAGGK